MISVVVLLVIVFLSYRAAPREKQEHAHVHGAGQVGLLAALALFGVDYFTSYFYATGEMMHALHPYGLQGYAYVAAFIIGLANFVFGGLYIYSLGIFNEGGGAYTASMRYLWPSLSLIVAVTLIQDYVLTVVVSALSGADQLLSIDQVRFALLGLWREEWFWHFLAGALLAGVTWFLTIRGRGESAQTVFMMLGVFVLMTLVMAVGLIMAAMNGVPAVPSAETVDTPSLGQALFHVLAASMKGMVALTGLEAMSNGIQFVITEDAEVVQWGRKRFPQWERLWHFYSGRVGIGRLVQTSFLFYGGLTTMFLAYFSIHFNVYDGVLGRTLVGNLAQIGFLQIPGGELLFWVYQVLAVGLLAAASMTAFQDLQSSEWRDVAMGEIPEIIIYRDPRGTFTRSVTISFGLSVLIMLLVRGQTTIAVPFYGVGVFMPIMVMGLAVRAHVSKTYARGTARTMGIAGATFAAVLAALVFVGQIVSKWNDGGWMALASFITLSLIAHLVLISPWGERDPEQIHRIVRDKARVQGAMASIVEWQSLRMQEYRHTLLAGMGQRRVAPVKAGPYDDSLHVDQHEAESPLQKYLQPAAPVATMVEPVVVEPAVAAGEPAPVPAGPVAVVPTPAAPAPVTPVSTAVDDKVQS